MSYFQKKNYSNSAVEEHSSEIEKLRDLLCLREVGFYRLKIGNRIGQF